MAMAGWSRDEQNTGWHLCHPAFQCHRPSYPALFNMSISSGEDAVHVMAVRHSLIVEFRYT